MTFPNYPKIKWKLCFSNLKDIRFILQFFPFHSLLFAFGIGEDTALQPHVGQTIGLLKTNFTINHATPRSQIPPLHLG